MNNTITAAAAMRIAEDVMYRLDDCGIDRSRSEIALAVGPMLDRLGVRIAEQPTYSSGDRNCPPRASGPSIDPLAWSGIPEAAGCAPGGIEARVVPVNGDQRSSTAADARSMADVDGHTAEGPPLERYDGLLSADDDGPDPTES